MNNEKKGFLKQNLDRNVLRKAIAIAIVIELITLPVVYSTMGHAGPSGVWAPLGWLGVLINLPGLIVSVFVTMLIPSVFGFYISVGIAFIVQTVILTGLFYTYLRD